MGEKLSTLSAAVEFKTHFVGRIDGAAYLTGTLAEAMSRAPAEKGGQVETIATIDLESVVALSRVLATIRQLTQDLKDAARLLKSSDNLEAVALADNITQRLERTE